MQFLPWRSRESEHWKSAWGLTREPYNPERRYVPTTFDDEYAAVVERPGHSLRRTATTATRAEDDGDSVKRRRRSDRDEEGPDDRGGKRSGERGDGTARTGSGLRLLQAALISSVGDGGGGSSRRR